MARKEKGPYLYNPRVVRYLRRMSSRPKRVAVGYARVSTEKQAAEGVSLDAQRQEIISFSVASGFDLIDVLSDEGVSGAKHENSRPGLSEVLELVRTKQVAVVVVTRRDRLARTLAIGGYFETEIARAGGELIAIEEVGQSDIVRAVMKMVAEVERLLAAQRTRAAMKALKARGQVLGRVPFGYARNQDGRLDPVPAEIKVLRRVQRLRADGRSLREIAEELTRSGVPTRRGGRWSAQHVRLLLQRQPGGAPAPPRRLRESEVAVGGPR